jgi:hypothetical protein
MLIVSLDVGRIGDQSRYTGDILHQLSTEIGGKLKRSVPVYLSNSSGIRWVFLLSSLPKMPHRVDFPAESPRGKAAIGVRFDGTPILVGWDSIPHWAVLGITGSGKSGFLRLLAFQALRDDLRLMLADLDETTFPMLSGHPSLLAPIATTPADALELVQQAVGECDHRKALYNALPEHPEKLSEYKALAVKHGLEPLPPVLVVLDEASAILQAMGGGKGEMARTLAALGWRGRKFGLHFVFAGQDLTKDLTGPVREQAGLSLCFRVKNAQLAANLGCRGAQRIPEGRPGLAITDRFGPIQTFFVDKSLFGQSELLRPVLSVLERNLFERALVEAAGRLPAARVEAWGNVSTHQARKMLEQWELRGWVTKAPERDNAFCVTSRTQALLANSGDNPTNPQTAQTYTNPLKPSETERSA